MSAKTLSFVFSFALPLLLVRRMSQTEYGLYKQVFLVVSTSIMILPLGFGMSAFYFLPREEGERQRQIIFNIVLFNAVMGGLICLTLALYPTLLQKIFGGPELVVYAPLIGVVILLWLVSLFIDIAPVANQETKMATVLIISTQLTRALSLLAAATFFGTVRSLIYAAMIHGAIQLCLLILYLRSRWSGFWRSFNPSLFRTQLAYALPFSLAGLLYGLQTDLHNYFVSHTYGPEAFAVYANGCFQIPLLWFLAEAVSSVMLPRVSELQNEGEHRAIVMLAAQAMRKLAVIFFPSYAFLLVVGHEFIVFLFTERYAASWPIFAVNLTVIPFAIMMLDPIMRSYAEHRNFLLKLHGALLIVLLVALSVGTKIFGLLGVISIVVGANIAGRLATAIKVGYILRIKRSDWTLLKDVGKVALASAVAALVTALVRAGMSGARPFMVLVVCGVAFSLVYLAAMLLLRVLTLDEREIIRHKFARLRRKPLNRTAEPLL